MRVAKSTQLDPLYVIFEQHLYNFQDSDLDRKTFIELVVTDYLTYLRRMKIVVPKSLEQSICEELAQQIHTMLVKKIYGFLSIQEYQNQLPGMEKRKVKSRYTRMLKKARV